MDATDGPITIDDLILSLETRLAEVKKFRENKVGKLKEDVKWNAR
jgi:hypothetical protein